MTKENEFDVAKAVHELLAGLSRDKQLRVLRWVAESFEITVFKDRPVSAEMNAPLSTKAQSGTSDITASGSRKDVRSFVDDKAPKNDVQFATVIAYYYQFEAPAEERREDIDSELLQNCTRLVGRERLKSPSAALNNAKNLGYLDSRARGTFAINTVGENLVAMTLPGDGSVRKSKPRNGPKKSGSTKKNSAKKST